MFGNNSCFFIIIIILVLCCCGNGNENRNGCNIGSNRGFNNGCGCNNGF